MVFLCCHLEFIRAIFGVYRAPGTGAREPFADLCHAVIFEGSFSQGFSFCHTPAPSPMPSF